MPNHLLLTLCEHKKAAFSSQTKCDWCAAVAAVRTRGQGTGSFPGLFFPAPLTGCSLSWDLHLTLQGEQSGGIRLEEGKKVAFP